jgi:hypothetical protein
MKHKSRSLAVKNQPRILAENPSGGKPVKLFSSKATLYDRAKFSAWVKNGKNTFECVKWIMDEYKVSKPTAYSWMEQAAIDAGVFTR